MSVFHVEQICPRCGAEHERSQAYCLTCHAANMREWRKTHALSPEAAKRDSARSYAGEYKKRGKLVQQPCIVCDAPDVEMHHPDHEQPLLIAWLCRRCHLDWHAHWKLTALRTWNNWRDERRRRHGQETAA